VVIAKRPIFVNEKLNDCTTLNALSARRSMSDVISSGDMKGNKRVICAGTPKFAEASKRHRSSATVDSAAGTSTTNADVDMQRPLRLIIGLRRYDCHQFSTTRPTTVPGRAATSSKTFTFGRSSGDIEHGYRLALSSCCRRTRASSSRRVASSSSSTPSRSTGRVSTSMRPVSSASTCSRPASKSAQISVP